MEPVAVPPDQMDKLLQSAGDAVLVGGQALALWLSYYRIPVDDMPEAVVTKDADFLGTREDAARLAKAVGGTLEHPKGMTILNGVIRKHVARGQGYEVDVLRKIAGPSPAEVLRNAKEISDTLTGARYRVMSPIDCLASRLENLRTIRDKQGASGAWQARAAVAVTRAHLEALLDEGEEKAAIRIATRVLRAATMPMGLHAHRNHRIDVLEAVPVARFRSKNFVDQQWRRSVARIEGVRGLGT